jgi:hypothetical protein
MLTPQDRYTKIFERRREAVLDHNYDPYGNSFSTYNIEQMKRDADNLNLAKWIAIVFILGCAAITAYCVRFV